MEKAAQLPHPHGTTDPSRFGRVEADGSVWLTTADGERQIGSWQAGTPEEGLAHYGLRFDDLATEVELLEERLSAGSGDPVATARAAATLLAGLDEAAVIGDIENLRVRLTTIAGGAEEAAARAKADREQAKLEATARKEALLAEAEELCGIEGRWRATGDRLRAIGDEWRAIRGVDRKVDDAMTKRLHRARDTFSRRRGAHFAEMDKTRASAKTRKEQLIADAEALSASTDWAPTANRYRELLEEWKAAGRASREVDDALWARFKAAQDVFFAARSASHSEREAEYSRSAEAKRAALTEAEKAVEQADSVDAARAAVRALHDRWDELGRVPREHIGQLEARLRALDEKVRHAEERQWRRTDPEAIARAAQFTAKADGLERDAERAAASGNAKKAAQLSEQASQWRQWAATATEAVSGR